MIEGSCWSVEVSRTEREPRPDGHGGDGAPHRGGGPNRAEREPRPDGHGGVGAPHRGGGPTGVCSARRAEVGPGINRVEVRGFEPLTSSVRGKNGTLR